jgi:hypothetical protein
MESSRFFRLDNHFPPNIRSGKQLFPLQLDGFDLTVFIFVFAGETGHEEPEALKGDPHTQHPK